MLWAWPEAVFSENFSEQRKRMVEIDIRGRGISDPAVLEAMLRVPRHDFVESRHRHVAYSDTALPIKKQQTISQPYIVALMTQSAHLKPGDRVLEVGTGSAYQAAVLAEIVTEVYSIEIIESLAKEAERRLIRLGYENVNVRHGDGYLGWEDAGPFDAILITAAAPEIPQPLVDQLKPGGRLVMPLGNQRLSQDLMVFTKNKNGLEKEFITGVVFVPMTGEIRR
ncbi:MAG: protein-L-isoaspartate O-methyltransferase [Nitrospinaceae bacterium]|nr:MAG: protein-L-isoaspartate O-methyltransferase [Nitrospinaceae bacterium]